MFCTESSRNTGAPAGVEQVTDVHEREHNELLKLLREVALGEVWLEVQRAQDLNLELLWGARGHGELVRHGWDEAALLPRQGTLSEDGVEIRSRGVYPGPCTVLPRFHRTRARRLDSCYG